MLLALLSFFIWDSVSGSFRRVSAAPLPRPKPRWAVSLSLSRTSWSLSRLTWKHAHACTPFPKVQYPGLSEEFPRLDCIMIRLSDDPMENLLHVCATVRSEGTIWSFKKSCTYMFYVRYDFTLLFSKRTATSNVFESLQVCNDPMASQLKRSCMHKLNEAGSGCWLHHSEVVLCMTAQVCGTYAKTV